MKTIQISDATFAGIWSNWKDGDEGEEGVIRRLLGLSEKKESEAVAGKKVGFRDARYGVEFPNGFEIFRVFKGREIRARAQDGGWMTEHNRFFTSLNKLSAHIGAPTENAWEGWSYMDRDKKKAVGTLRDENMVARRV